MLEISCLYVTLLLVYSTSAIASYLSDKQCHFSIFWTLGFITICASFAVSAWGYQPDSNTDKSEEHSCQYTIETQQGKTADALLKTLPKSIVITQLDGKPAKIMCTKAKEKTANE